MAASLCTEPWRPHPSSYRPTGHDVAVETAEIALLSDDLSRVPHLLELSISAPSCLASLRAFRRARIHSPLAHVRGSHLQSADRSRSLSRRHPWLSASALVGSWSYCEIESGGSNSCR